MLTEIYIESLLVDEELADQVWEAWDKGEIDDATVWLAWWTIRNAGIFDSDPGVSLVHLGPFLGLWVLDNPMSPHLVVPPVFGIVQLAIRDEVCGRIVR